MAHYLVWDYDYRRYEVIEGRASEGTLRPFDRDSYVTVEGDVLRDIPIVAEAPPASDWRSPWAIMPKESGYGGVVYPAIPEVVRATGKTCSTCGWDRQSIPDDRRCPECEGREVTIKT